MEGGLVRCAPTRAAKATKRLRISNHHAFQKGLGFHCGGAGEESSWGRRTCWLGFLCSIDALAGPGSAALVPETRSARPPAGESSSEESWALSRGGEGSPS